MLSTVLLMTLILSIGSSVSDQVRLRQEEVILRKLPLEQAHDFYEVLRRRARRIKIFRALALVSLVVLVMAYKQRFVKTTLPPPAAETPAAKR